MISPAPTLTWAGLVTRVVLFVALASILLVVLGGGQQALGVVPAEFTLAQWAPGLAALAMLAILRRDRARLTFSLGPSPIARSALAFGIPLVAAAAVWLIWSFVPDAPQSPWEQSLPLTLLWLPLGALGEELGWRGYLHKLLDRRMPGLASSVVVGLIWLPIHVGLLGLGPAFVALFSVVLVSASIIIYALVQEADFSVPIATFFHISINVGNLLFLGSITTTAFMMVNATVWAIAAAVVVLARRSLFLTARGTGS